MRSHNFASAGTLSNLPCSAGVLRDDFRPDSDVDVLLTDEPLYRLTLSHLLNMQGEIEHLFDRSVDLVEKKQLKNPDRRSNLRENLSSDLCKRAIGIVLHASRSNF